MTSNELKLLMEKAWESPTVFNRFGPNKFVMADDKRISSSGYILPGSDEDWTVSQSDRFNATKRRKEDAARGKDIGAVT